MGEREHPLATMSSTNTVTVSRMPEIGGDQVALVREAAGRVDILQSLGLEGRVDFRPGRVNTYHLAS